MEALACGRPLVASRTGALTTLITAARGLTVAPGDARPLGTALVAALQRSWDNAAIAASVREDSWARAAAAYLRVYQQAAELTVPTGTRAALSA
jgi:glycosyltransferase involved in cell wall biosynthesis